MLNSLNWTDAVGIADVLAFNSLDLFFFLEGGGGKEGSIRIMVFRLLTLDNKQSYSDTSHL